MNGFQSNSVQSSGRKIAEKSVRLSVTSLFSVLLFTAMLNIVFWMPTWAAPLVAAPDAVHAVVGDGSAASCTEAALASALTAALSAGGEVTFNCGGAAHTILLTSSKNLNANVAINGGGLITLDGNNSTRIFDIPANGNVTLRGLTLVNSPASASGIYNSGKLAVIDSIFRNHLRGAIYNAGGTVAVVNNLFEDNQRTAITNENKGTLSITGSTFLRNTMTGSGNGGAVFNSSSGIATVVDSLFEQNQAGDGGGAIYNSYMMTVTHSIVRNNEAYGGGGIYNNGVMLLQESHISGNKATGTGGAGGGLSHFNQTTTPSSITIVQSTFDNNVSTRHGGGIWLSGEHATLTMQNSTLFNNTAQEIGGGGLYVTSGDAILTHVTLAANKSLATEGGSIENSPNLPGSITLRNTLIVEGGCVGGTIDEGGNLQFPAATCGVTVAAQDPMLAALADNGGWTPTLAFAENGPAQNSANNGNCLPTDQRGVLRPQFATCDVGAFEWGAKPIVANIAPDSTLALSPTFTLAVNGSNFIPGPSGTAVMWGDVPLPTVYVNSTLLHVTVAANLIEAGGQIQVGARTTVVDGAVSDHTAHFTVIKRDQSVSFGELVNRAADASVFTVEASATSGLAVSFVANGVCTVSGNTVTLTGQAGTCTVTAQQAGNASYNAAPDVAHSFEVLDGTSLFIPHVFGG